MVWISFQYKYMLGTKLEFFNIVRTDFKLDRTISILSKFQFRSTHIRTISKTLTVACFFLLWFVVTLFFPFNHWCQWKKLRWIHYNFLEELLFVNSYFLFETSLPSSLLFSWALKCILSGVFKSGRWSSILFVFFIKCHTQ